MAKLSGSPRAAALVAAAVLLAATVAAAPAALADAAPTTVYVSPAGSDGASCSQSAPCQTIAHAVSIAAPGATVVVEAGTYHGQVTVTTDLTLQGQGLPIIDATGQTNGILIQGPGAAGAVVRGFQVENAQMEGILVLGTTGVTVQGNVVVNNDLGAFASKLVGECAPQGVVPGDCGEGLHLMGSSDSRVVGNLVAGNQGGILVTDEVGPAADNWIAHNVVVNNPYDCGITLAAHNPRAFAGGAPQPSVGGVYGNTVTANTVAENGLITGAGGGVLIGAGPPGTAAYNNVISDNYLADDALPGVTIHSHAPGQDINGNQILDNVISDTGVNGGIGGAAGDMDAQEAGTAGILLFSAVTSLQGTVVSGNIISSNHYGIWTRNVPASSVGANTFGDGVAVQASLH